MRPAWILSALKLVLPNLIAAQEKIAEGEYQIVAPTSERYDLRPDHLSLGFVGGLAPSSSRAFQSAPYNGADINADHELSFEHHRLIPIQQNPILNMPPHRARQHHFLQVASLLDQIFD